MSSQDGYERQNNGSTKKSWALRFFLLSINFFLIFLIIRINQLRIISLGLLGLAVLILFVKFIQKKMKADVPVDDNPRDLLPLFMKYLRINRKYLLVSILGLSVALVVVSQIVILSNSGTGNIYDNALSGGQVPVFEASRDNFEQELSSSNNFSTIMDAAREKFESVTAEHNLKVKDMHLSYEYEFLLMLEPPMDLDQGEHYQGHISLESSTIDKQELEHLREFPNFPNVEYKENLTILTIHETEIMEETRDQFSDISELNFTNMDRTNNFTIDADGLWIISEEDRKHAYNTDNWYLMNKVENTIIASIGNEVDLFGEVISTFHEETLYGQIETEDLKGRDPSDVLSSLRAIRNAMEGFFYDQGYNDISVTSRAVWEVQWVRYEEANIRFFLLLVSLPMLGIALYLVYFSLNLVELRKQNLVSIMKIRGISSSQLKFMMTVETVIAALVSAIIAMAISAPWSQYILDTTLIYGENAEILLTFEWYWSMPVVAIILAIDLNIGSIFSISSTSVEEGEAGEEQKEPFWRRLYLDVIMTVVGVGTWLVIRFIPFQPEVMQFVLFIGVWTLPVLVIGLPLFVSRYYSTFLTFISDFLWKREGNLFALATRNMRRNKFSASKLAVLLMIGMMFSFVAIGVPHSVNIWTEEASSYRAGADFRINNIDLNNATHLEVIENRTDIDAHSVFHAQRFSMYTQQYGDVSIMGINASNYADAAFWKSSYASQPLEDLLDQIRDNKTLVQTNGMDVLSVDKGDNLVVNLGQGGQQQDSTVINEEIGGSFKYWPSLFERLYYYENFVRVLAIVMPIDVFQGYFNHSFGHVFAKASENANHTLIQEELEESYEGFTSTIGTSVTVTSAIDQQDQLFGGEEVELMFAMFDTLLIVTIITSIIGVGYFSFITLQERRREIGVFRAVGMVSKQIFLLLVVESIILVCSSLIIGVLSGSFIASNLFLVLGNEFVGGIPPISLKYPTLLTIGFVGVTLLLSIIAAAIPARSTASKQTGSILRAE